jgi:hypothetical protein
MEIRNSILALSIEEKKTLLNQIRQFSMLHLRYQPLALTMRKLNDPTFLTILKTCPFYNDYDCKLYFLLHEPLYKDLVKFVTSFESKTKQDQFIIFVLAINNFIA